MSKKILFLGDSLVEGYGVSKEMNWVSLVGRQLEGFECINQGRNGILSNQVKEMLQNSLSEEIFNYYVILCGSNDFIQGISLDKVVKNLQTMEEIVIQAGGKAIIVLPPNPHFEEEYPFVSMNTLKSLSRKIVDLNSIFRNKALVLSDYLKNEKYFFDGIHPTEEGHRCIAKAFKDYGVSEGFWS